MRNDAQFPDAEGGTKVRGIGICGAEWGESCEGMIDILHGLPQLIIAAPSADQQKCKACAALVQNGKACAIISHERSKAMQRRLGAGAGLLRDPVGSFVQIIPFQRYGTHAQRSAR